MSERQESTWIRLGGPAGIITPAVAFTFIGLSIATYPQFSWMNNALSDLGVVSGATSSLFNFGLFVAGLLSLNFAFGLYRFLDKRLIGKVGAVLFVVASLSLIGIGIANENFSPFHYIFSVMFFTFMPISLLVIAGYFLISRQKSSAAFTLFIGILAAAPWVLYFIVQYASGVAIPELLSGLAGSAWAVVTGWMMLKASSRTKNPEPAK